MMVRAIVHRDGDRVLLEVVTGNDEISELKEGQELSFTIDPESPEEMSDAEFDAMVDHLIDENREALEYLAQ